MSKDSKNKEISTGEVVYPGEVSPEIGDLSPALSKVIVEIEQLFVEAQKTSISALWSIGFLIAEVSSNPDKYLTDQQQAAYVDATSLIMSIFAPVYSADQLRSAVLFFEKYPSEHELNRLLTMRCPERPRWRLTASHVQLLAQIPDDTQRAAIEEKCAEEAFTARTLAGELKEVKGTRKAGAGRTHEAPKGIKQQVADLLNHQRRFIGRSDQLWLNEESDNIYDDLANTAPDKLDATVRGYFNEIEENFSRLSDIIADHVAMCRKLREEVFDKTEVADEDVDEEEITDAEPKRKPHSNITR